MAERLVLETEILLQANERDRARGKAEGISAPLLERLLLTPERIASMAAGLRELVALPDPIGPDPLETVLEERVRPNGLRITKVVVPLGVVGIIYEARPNVTVDAAGLCFKTGNAVVLRGGSAALYSCQAIVDVLHRALQQVGLPYEGIQYIADPHRSAVDEMVKLNGVLDVVIPRGGASLIQSVVRNATVPVIETGAGICHTYIDEEAELQMALAIAVNAKTHRPSVCNAMETLLVHEEFARHHLRAIVAAMHERGVQIRACERSRALLPEETLQTASEQDFSTEYNDLILNLRVVPSLDEALCHIARFGTLHSECIVTNNADRARRFLREVDAAAVYHNASTRFTDGGEFGFGAEIGISTQKLHARGPMGLSALTSIKYQVTGTGQVRS
jgi:glutamate-5-semialdehyde dehydrogenase